MLYLSGPITLILLRYVAAAWVTKAGLSIDVNDPDVFAVANFAIGGLLAVAAEGWYAIARKNGWGH